MFEITPIKTKTTTATAKKVFIAFTTYFLKLNFTNPLALFVCVFLLFWIKFYNKTYFSNIH